MNLNIFTVLKNRTILQILLLAPSVAAASAGAPSSSIQQPENKHNASSFTIPLLGDNVYVFDPGMDMQRIQALMDSIGSVQHDRKSEFSLKRYAFLFRPGKYNLDIRMGYYMQLLGLGRSPDEVEIHGSLLSKGFSKGNVTLNFWRGVENLSFTASTDTSMTWGVSQASPMRRVHIRGDIRLHDNGWASGGFLADSKVDGRILSGPQQQWFTRNSTIGKWEGGSWNMMFTGVQGAPEDKWPENPYTVIQQTPLVREKPYLVASGNGFSVVVPALKENSSGKSWQQGADKSRLISLKKFYIVHPSKDNSASINKALAEGRHLLFTPGIYQLDQSLKVTRPGTILLGIGMATLVPMKGNSTIEAADADDLTISGLLFDAGRIPSETLVRIGEPGANSDHGRKPSFLHDLFFRVGGPAEGVAANCLVINSRHVVVDHTWIWRADHGNGVGWEKNRGETGLVVNGDFVTIYGLFNEHFQGYQTIWNGNHGRLYFYQSELPYDPPTVDAWKHGDIGGYASYKVGDGVKDHEAWGLGIYCVFYAANAVVTRTIETPPHLENSIHHKIIFWLNGMKESSIQHIINDKGEGVNINRRKSVME